MATHPQQQAPIRVALVITELEMGGAECCLTNLAIGLAGQRFIPVVYSLAPRPPIGRDQLVRRLDDAGIGVEFIGATAPYQFPSAVQRLRSRLRTHSPHLVQSFLFHANVVGTIAARREMIPAIAVGFRVAEPNWCRQRIEQRVARHADRVVCVSQSVADYAKAKMNLAIDKLSVIPNGVDLEMFPAKTSAKLEEFGIPVAQPTIVAIGRLEKQKGIDWLLRIAPRFLHRLTNHHLLIVGAGRERAKLEKLSMSLNLSRQVHFAGWQPNVAEILRASCMLVLPSRWEGMPNVLVEAMASGLPVVSAAAEGVAEVLGPQAELQTTPFNNDDGFVTKVERIATNAELAKTLGHANRQRVISQFSLTGMISQYAELFQALVSA